MVEVLLESEAGSKLQLPPLHVATIHPSKMLQFQLFCSNWPKFASNLCSVGQAKFHFAVQLIFRMILTMNVSYDNSDTVVYETKRGVVKYMLTAFVFVSYSCETTMKKL
jgi:hypothetical protein